MVMNLKTSLTFAFTLQISKSLFETVLTFHAETSVAEISRTHGWEISNKFLTWVCLV